MNFGLWVCRYADLLTPVDLGILAFWIVFLCGFRWIWGWLGILCLQV